MNLNRRQIIKGIGAALCAGVVPKFCAELIAPVDSHVLHVAAHVDMLKTSYPLWQGTNISCRGMPLTLEMIRQAFIDLKRNQGRLYV